MEFYCGYRKFQSTLPLRGATQRDGGWGHPPLFQSTLPLRGATTVNSTSGSLPVISIHAPLAGSDAIIIDIYHHHPDFNPRSPCGERRQRDGGWGHPPLFQSTLPLRGATFAIPSALPSIGFQSTLPLRGATVSALVISVFPCISIHAPLAGSDRRRLLWPA